MTPVDEFANSPFLRRNSSEVWKSIAHLGTLLSFEKGQTIYHQGDLTNQLFYLESGRVKIFMIEPGGLERLMTIVERETRSAKLRRSIGIPTTSLLSR